VGARASPQKSAAGLLWHVTDLLAWGGPSKQGRPYPATIGNRNRFVDHPAHPTHRAPARCTPSGQGAWTAASRRASRLSVPTALRCGQRCAACRPGGRRASSAQAVAFVSAQASTPPHLRPTSRPPSPLPLLLPHPPGRPHQPAFHAAHVLRVPPLAQVSPNPQAGPLLQPAAMGEPLAATCLDAHWSGGTLWGL
jgi:hypothetical protein